MTLEDIVIIIACIGSMAIIAVTLPSIINISDKIANFLLRDLKDLDNNKRRNTYGRNHKRK